VKKEIARQLGATAAVMHDLAAKHLDTIAEMAEALIAAARAGRCLYLCGNGGSAADAQHIAAEFVGRFLRERRALPAVALTTNTSILTAIGNDYGYERVFERQVEALVRPGDCLLALSTSGNSPNVLRAVEAARRRGAKTLGFTGPDGGALARAVDLCLPVPAPSTPRVQEGHIAVAHVLCDLVETAF
jgi:D-sedoheptulose 7-phosphate isomerase